MDGIGTALCWSPSGSLIAASQVLRDTITRVIFFERNGLRHREFDIENANPAHYRVAALQWNAESDVLAVLLDSVADGMHGSRLQLWHRSNYHWFMKREIRVGGPGAQAGADKRISCVGWDQEKAYRLTFCVAAAGEAVEARELDVCWDYTASITDDCTVANIDGGGPMSLWGALSSCRG